MPNDICNQVYITNQTPSRWPNIYLRKRPIHKLKGRCIPFADGRVVKLSFVPKFHRPPPSNIQRKNPSAKGTHRPFNLCMNPTQQTPNAQSTDPNIPKTDPSP